MLTRGIHVLTLGMKYPDNGVRIPRTLKACSQPLDLASRRRVRLFACRAVSGIMTDDLFKSVSRWLFDFDFSTALRSADGMPEQISQVSQYSLIKS